MTNLPPYHTGEKPKPPKRVEKSKIVPPERRFRREAGFIPASKTLNQIEYPPQGALAFHNQALRKNDLMISQRRKL
ncbi:hypothetical protein CQA63_00890 [Helicobacter marmotae]|uniref:Uncharacterized protein n=1 Tax=Helicobacter marmotae TaxID=152490 RepID=A0A3D8I8J3_9HELI|nr:hypothetical protein CQA63_00890 [Helicobacter marmotae]